jgi:GNAT superfamily N-acetyltransferase
MEIDVRPAIADDAESIADAHVAAWRVAYRGVMPDDVLDSPALDDARRRGWRRRFEDPDGFTPRGWDLHDELFVAELSGRVVGFGNVGREWTGDDGGDADERHVSDRHADDTDRARGELYGFYLHPDAWGSGVADVLIDTCHRSLRRRFSTASLWVLRDNPRARRFYERHGWTHPVDDESAQMEWPGPQMDGMPSIGARLVAVQYVRDLTPA